MMEMSALEKWIAKRKMKLAKTEEAKPTSTVGLPNGMTIHIHVNTGEAEKPDQKIPLTSDGKAVATRDAVARYPG